MQINTTRFGTVDVQAEDILLFPLGIIGFEQCLQWVLLADASNDSLGWLQSVQDPQIAMPVVSPRRFAPDYRVKVSPAQLELLELGAEDETFVLVVLARNEDSLTMNLKAPLIVNLDKQVGRQVITSDDQPLQRQLAEISEPLRKSA
ncbi:MAG TPA: hypothetical protein DCY79_26110 [Planctomycetaceae bacterium]|jgi:flagellar assembly factor FliW|nr:hypothetical protein [Blastopirellula sp.]HAY83297.1 hypothetical protein [Planctomycetaceae bacterium]